MTTVRALIKKDPATGHYVAWVPRLMPAARCESDDFATVNEEIERTVHRLMEQLEPGSTLNGVRIETASVI
jgi:hypothetical protein